MPYLDFDAIKREITMSMVLDALGWRDIWRQGGKKRGPCPIHRSSDPRSLTFAVNEKGFFCHKCKANGDQIRLWAEVFGLSAYDAALQLCERFHVPPYQLPRFAWRVRTRNGEEER